MTDAPFATARIELATPIPKSMWKWVSSGTSILALTASV